MLVCCRPQQMSLHHDFINWYCIFFCENENCVIDMIIPRNCKWHRRRCVCQNKCNRILKPCHAALISADVFIIVIYWIFEQVKQPEMLGLGRPWQLCWIDLLIVKIVADQLIIISLFYSVNVCVICCIKVHLEADRVAQARNAVVFLMINSIQYTWL